MANVSGLVMVFRFISIGKGYIFCYGYAAPKCCYHERSYRF